LVHLPLQQQENNVPASYAANQMGICIAGYLRWTTCPHLPMQQPACTSLHAPARIHCLIMLVIHVHFCPCSPAVPFAVHAGTGNHGVPVFRVQKCCSDIQEGHTGGDLSLWPIKLIHCSCQLLWLPAVPCLFQASGFGFVLLSECMAWQFPAVCIACILTAAVRASFAPTRAFILLVSRRLRARSSRSSSHSALHTIQQTDLTLASC